MIGNDRPELERFNIRRLGYLNMIREKKRSRSKRTRRDRGERS